jgi:hypothetical protein
MKTLTAVLFFAICFLMTASMTAAQSKPDFSKMTTVTVERPSQSATSSRYKVDEWPADPYVHEVPDLTISSVWVEANGWHMMLNCTNRLFTTLGCAGVPVGNYRFEFKGKRNFTVTTGDSRASWREVGPAKLTIFIPEGKKLKKVTYSLDMLHRCDDSGETRRCVFYDSQEF